MNTPRFQSLDQAPDDGNFDYGKKYFREALTSGERLVIGQKDGHIDTMESLARNWRGPWYSLYVLVVSRTGRDLGRYQSEVFDDFTDLQVFDGTHQKFLEGDGRHHYWIGSTSGDGLLVYDQHNVIFAYGDIADYEQKLNDQGFRRSEFWFPAPHQHHYHPDNDMLEDELFEAMEWIHAPFQDGDEWD